MNIYVIYGYNPNATMPQLEIADIYDFERHHTGKLMLTKKDFSPALNMLSLENQDILNFNFGHLTVDTLMFVNWAGRLVEFSAMLQTKAGALHSPPFTELMGAVNNLRSCPNWEVRKIAQELVEWKQEALRFGPDDFAGAYELMTRAFSMAADDGGGVWIKYL